jgi:hypothetical protein
VKSKVFKSVSGWAVDLPAGHSGDLELERQFLIVLAELFELFCGKQADYGVTNISEAGMPGLATRLNDKVARFRNIALGHDPLNESLRDNLIDIADYGVIAVLVNDGKWPKAKEKEKEEQNAARKIRAIKALLHERGLAVTQSQIKEILYDEDE